MRFGSWWAVQPGRERLLELGVHVEPRRRRTNKGVRYGPYLDLHLPGVCMSVGRNPIYAGEADLKASTSRGGVSGDADAGC